MEIEVSGGPRARGEQHGEAARSLIEEALGRWRETMAARGQDPRARISAIAERTPYAATVADRLPDLLTEIRGIAAGAGIPLADALALNLMDEEWWFSPEEESGCSLVAGRQANGVPLLAQNMDLPAWMEGLQTVIRVRDRDEETVLLSAAGMLGLTGARLGANGGLAVGVNTLLQLPRSTRGLPVAFVLRAALAQPSAVAAATWLAAVPHASGQHYAVIDDTDVFGVECGAGIAATRQWEGSEWLVHTNHPLWSDSAVVLDSAAVGIVGARLHSSERRLAALERLAAAPLRSEATRAALADVSTGVCMLASPEYPTATFGCVEYVPGEGRAVVIPKRPTAARWAEADRSSRGSARLREPPPSTSDTPQPTTNGATE